MSDAPFFHDDSRSVRFWILVDGRPFGASVSRDALHHRFRPTMHDDDPLDTYLANAAEIEAAVRRRLAQGSREPVLLREHDLRGPGAQESA